MPKERRTENGGHGSDLSENFPRNGLRQTPSGFAYLGGDLMGAT